MRLSVRLLLVLFSKVGRPFELGPILRLKKRKSSLLQFFW